MTVSCPMKQWTLVKRNFWNEKICELCEKQGSQAQMKNNGHRWRTASTKEDCDRWRPKKTSKLIAYFKFKTKTVKEKFK